MASLLTIPLELREEVIKDVLFATKPANPSADLDIISQRAFRLQPWGGKTWDAPTINLPTTGFSSLTSHGLLHSNRQISRETQKVLRRTKPSHKLDVTVSGDLMMAFHFTWLRIPTLQSRIDTLEMTVRMTNPPFDLWDRRDTRGPPDFILNLYDLLEHLVRFGPPLEPAPGPANKGIVIDVIKLDFATLHDGSDLPSMRDEFCTHLRELLSLNSTVPGLSQFDYDAMYSWLFYEHFGTLLVSLNGNLPVKYDLGRMLDCFNCNNEEIAFVHAYPREARATVLKQWKERMLQRRRAVGLS